jgi:uncharacterized membrane protein
MLFSTKQLVRWSVVIAMTVAVSLFVKIPLPYGGVFCLIDTGIIFIALLDGGKAGLIVGALSGLLFDLLSGYAHFAPFSLMIHGLEGLVVGYLIMRIKPKHLYTTLLAAALATIIVPCGYFGVNTMYYGIPSAIAGLVADFTQAVLGVGVGLLLYYLYRKVYLKEV